VGRDFIGDISAETVIYLDEKPEKAVFNPFASKILDANLIPTQL
jgi:hypothetical protein